MKTMLFLRGVGELESLLFFYKQKKNLKKGVISVYINLQSCYEEIRTSNSEEQELMNKYNVYLKFFNQILEKIKNDCKKIFQDKDIEKLFEEIKNGEYIDENFRRTMQFATNSEKNTQFNLNANTDKKAEAGLSFSQKNATEEQYTKQEMRIFSINTVLNKMKKILDKHSVAKVYLFLDDFSELAKDSQKLIVDSLIAPIISSYNDVFVIKLAAYPYRIYLGNIDSSKIVSYSLDFYDVYEIMNSKADQISFDVLKKAFAATCMKRETSFGEEKVRETLDKIKDDSGLEEMWNRFKRVNYFVDDLSWGEVSETIVDNIEKIFFLATRFLESVMKRE